MDQKSNNPFFRNKAFSEGETTLYRADGRPVEIIDYNNTMTVRGAVNKTAILFMVLLIGAATAWYMPYIGINPLVPAIAGAIIGTVLVIVSVFSPKSSRYTAPAYALFEGVFIGGISWYFNLKWPGIVLQAVAGTLVTFGVCLALYKFGVIKVTQQFRSVVMASMMAIFTLYMAGFILSFFGFTMFFYGTSIYSIGFSVFVVVIAAMRLFLDFDDIEQGAERNLPKYMEWFSAMGLMITLIWMYLEILKLLAKMQGRK